MQMALSTQRHIHQLEEIRLKLQGEGQKWEVITRDAGRNLSTAAKRTKNRKTQNRPIEIIRN